MVRVNFNNSQKKDFACWIFSTLTFDFTKNADFLTYVFLYFFLFLLFSNTWSDYGRIGKIGVFSPNFLPPGKSTFATNYQKLVSTAKLLPHRRYPFR